MVVSTPSADQAEPSDRLGHWITSPGPTISVLCWAGGVLLLLSSIVHLHLWSTGYRHIPTIGPLFLLQAISGLAIAVVIGVTRKMLATLAGAVFALGTIGGLVVSAEVGLFGFKDSFGAPYAGMSLALESAAAAILGVATLLALHRGAESRTVPSGP